jgi:hypothetical protein
MTTRGFPIILLSARRYRVILLGETTKKIAIIITLSTKDVASVHLYLQAIEITEMLCQTWGAV